MILDIMSLTTYLLICAGVAVALCALSFKQDWDENHGKLSGFIIPMCMVACLVSIAWPIFVIPLLGYILFDIFLKRR